MLSARLREARKHTGLSLADYAVLLDLNIRTVERWETGARCPSLLELCRVATMVGVSVTWLVSDLDEQRGEIALEVG